MPGIFKPTLVLGASPNPERFSYLAVRKLQVKDFPVFAVGLREGNIHGTPIVKPFPVIFDLHTVTLYVGKKNQPVYYDYIFYLHPRRVIFNPGTENEEFEEMLEARGIVTLRACTIILLSSGQY